jgi:hypothetical protein
MSMQTSATASGLRVRARIPIRSVGFWRWRPELNPQENVWQFIRDNWLSNRDHDWMMRLVEHRIGDRRVLRLIRKWLKAGVVEDGTRQPAVAATPCSGCYDRGALRR